MDRGALVATSMASQELDMTQSSKQQQQFLPLVQKPAKWKRQALFIKSFKNNIDFMDPLKDFRDTASINRPYFENYISLSILLDWKWTEILFIVIV